MSIYHNTLIQGLIATAFLGVVLILSSNAYATASQEDKVKTAIIYKITKFVTWPRKRQSLTICILGEGSINSELKKINRKSTMGRRLSITHKNANAPFDKLCDALYIHNTDNQTINRVVKRLKGKPVLTISDSKSFVDMGGMIGLSRSDKRMNFSINNSSAATSNLSINSKLLKLAKSVK